MQRLKVGGCLVILVLQGEVNWFAYNLPTIEFHNELYGFIQSIAIDENENIHMKESLMIGLSVKLEQNRSWIKEIKGVAKEPQSRTLQTFIRNSIHHPENKHNKKFTDAELKLSIEQMIKILQE